MAAVMRLLFVLVAVVAIGWLWVTAPGVVLTVAVIGGLVGWQLRRRGWLR